MVGVSASCSSNTVALLALYNRVLNSGYIPPRLKEAMVVAILKERRDPGVASSYRPIALTSRVCKLFKKCINRRSMHVLEANRLLDPFQCGFREQKDPRDVFGDPKKACSCTHTVLCASIL